MQVFTRDGVEKDKRAKEIEEMQLKESEEGLDRRVQDPGRRHFRPFPQPAAGRQLQRRSSEQARSFQVV